MIFKKLHKNQQGVTAIEMALILPIITFLVIALIDFGATTKASVELSGALRTGEQFAVGQPSNISNITSVVKNATTLPSRKVAVTTATFCECDGISGACGSTCNSGLATFVTIKAAYSVPLLISYPTIPNPFPLTKTVSVRVQ
jgi:Flp pilus assembly protein TadG